MFKTQDWFYDGRCTKLVRKCLHCPQVQGLTASLEVLSDSLALETPTDLPVGEGPARPPSRSAEIFGRLDSLEARVSALERMWSKAEEKAEKDEKPGLEKEMGMAVEAVELPLEPEAAGAVEVPGDVATVATLATGDPEQAPEQAPEPNLRAETPGEEMLATGFGTWSGEPGEMDEKLKFLRDHVLAAAPEQAELLSGIVKDVKYCLKRCELLFQLPEIKAYIKSFQASLHVNAMLQDRWLGPGARTRGIFDEDDLEGTGNPKLRLGQNHSAGDLTLSNLATDPITRARRSEPPNKRPFRTVTDWARPHTPLTVDPVLKSSTPSLPDIAPSR